LVQIVRATTSGNISRRPQGADSSSDPAAEAPSMSKPPRQRFAADAIVTMVRSMFEKLGTTSGDAGAIAEVLVWANLRGVDSHGISRIPRYVELFENGQANARPHLRITQPRSGIVVVDADRAPGPVALKRAAAEAVATAGKTGVAWASVRSTVHTGAIGYYTSQIAGADMIGIGVVAGMPNMAYAGSNVAGVATSPLSIAVPSARHGTVLLDMATAVIALGKIAQFRAAGTALAPGMALTREGEPTTDPALAEIPLPVGGAKGAGLSLMFELLASVLGGQPILTDFHSGAAGGRRHRQNGALIAVDIAAFGPVEEFKLQVDATVHAIKGLSRSPGVDELLYPGERGGRAFEERSRKGIPLGGAAWQKLSEDARKLGVSVPEPLLAG
jgi:LDH2 family malate/lactate/ureidoglycolate dehydrogenase